MNKNLLICEPHIDLQHTELFHSFQSLLAFPPGDDAIFEALSLLTTQMLEHFETEERFMSGIDMPAKEMDAHIQAHTRIIEGLTEIYLQSMYGLRVPFEEIINRVSSYVNEDFIELDLSLKAYAQKSG